jgi:hypothetical protein
MLRFDDVERKDEMIERTKGQANRVDTRKDARDLVSADGA